MRGRRARRVRRARVRRALAGPWPGLGEICAHGLFGPIRAASGPSSAPWPPSQTMYHAQMEAVTSIRTPRQRITGTYVGHTSPSVRIRPRVSAQPPRPSPAKGSRPGRPRVAAQLRVPAPPGRPRVPAQQRVSAQLRVRARRVRRPWRNMRPRTLRADPCRIWAVQRPLATEPDDVSRSDGGRDIDQNTPAADHGDVCRPYESLSAYPAKGLGPAAPAQPGQRVSARPAKGRGPAKGPGPTRPAKGPGPAKGLGPAKGPGPALHGLTSNVCSL